MPGLSQSDRAGLGYLSGVGVLEARFTLLDDTKMALLVILLQEGMVTFIDMGEGMDKGPGMTVGAWRSPTASFRRIRSGSGNTSRRDSLWITPRELWISGGWTEATSAPETASPRAGALELVS